MNGYGRVVRLLGWLRGYTSSGSSSGISYCTDQNCGSVKLLIITKFSIGRVASAPPDATKTNCGNQNYAKQSRHKEQQNVTTFYLVSLSNLPYNNRVYHHNDNEQNNPT